MEGFQDLVVVETHATAGLYERNAAQVYPVVERSPGNAESARKLVYVDELGRNWRRCRRDTAIRASPERTSSTFKRGPLVDSSFMTLEIGRSEPTGVHCLVSTRSATQLIVRAPFCRRCSSARSLLVERRIDRIGIHELHWR